MQSKKKLNKISTGHIFSEEFNGTMNPLWDIFPSDNNRITFTGDSIKILENTDKTELLIPSPKDSGYVFQTYIRYEPKESNNGGCIVKSITENYIECELSAEIEPIYYSYLKVMYSDNFVLNLRASKDGLNWEDFGSTKLLDSNSIGYYLNDNKNALEIFNCEMYKSNFITIIGIDKTQSIKIYDENNKEIVTNVDMKYTEDSVVIDLSSKLFPINNVRIEVESGGRLSDTITIDKLYGGDVYSFEPEIRFIVDEANMDNGDFDLGLVQGKERVYELQVVNEGNFTKTGILKIVGVSSYDKGDSMAYLMPYGDSSGSSELSKELEISLLSGTTTKFLIKIIKDSSCITIDDKYSFNIIFM
ncbi:hypothetical protein IR152_00930 [Clostridioides sp. ES-S-0108-01]|uniref:hypothetical protein n=1 Tax=Clostridioides sp. ES-S-0108-01 TaxID=2770773 RepID=UPI001D0C1CFB|nr:hypothetical protein [Clostridioides sp. ES-S-0108-01]UDN49979.1 hypothetical protein JJC16_11410 [Clostridioides sp. ES-S-0107-01]